MRLHELIRELWTANDTFSRTCLLAIIAEVPLVYGPWRALKKIFKEAEAKNDTEVYGAIAARIDMRSARSGYGYGMISGATLGYCARRAWRYLRRVAVQLPATYPDVACDFLVHYTDDLQGFLAALSASGAPVREVSEGYAEIRDDEDGYEYVRRTTRTLSAHEIAAVTA